MHRGGSPAGKATHQLDRNVVVGPCDMVKRTCMHLLAKLPPPPKLQGHCIRRVTAQGCCTQHMQAYASATQLLVLCF
jgi:hypothetical protein